MDTNKFLLIVVFHTNNKLLFIKLFGIERALAQTTRSKTLGPITFITRYAVLCGVMRCYAVLCGVMRCYAMLCGVMRCYADLIFHKVTSGWAPGATRNRVNFKVLNFYQRWMRRRSRSDFYDAAAAAARRRWPAAAAASSAARAVVRSARLAAAAANFGMLQPPQRLPAASRSGAADTSGCHCQDYVQRARNSPFGRSYLSS